MSQQRSIYVGLFASTLLALISANAFADATYSWMLPKTVIDVDFVYTFKKCINVDQGAELSFNVTPTLTPRAVPDLVVRRLEINPKDFDTFFKDRNIAITTFASSHILGSIGSNPTDQTAAIIGNILGGVTKLAGIALGVPAAPAAAPPPTKPTCGDVQKAADNVRDYKKIIQKLELDLEQGNTPPIKRVDDATIKSDTAQIQAYQTLMAEEQKKLTLTVKGTIDPGFGFSLSDAVEPPHTSQPKEIPNTGLIATIAPTSKELVQKKWLTAPINEDKNPLQINVYMDFENAKPYTYIEVSKELKKPPTYKQTVVDKDDSGDNPETGDLFRAPKYIPVLAWRGDKDAKASSEPLTMPLDDDDDGGGPPSTGPKQLVAPKAVPFAQYGFTEKLPITARIFRTISWAVTFNEFGEVTNATFSSKAWGSNATSLFGSAASAASSIAAEQQKAASPSAQAAATQAQADEIYQTQRLALCEAHPASCPSK